MQRILLINLLGWLLFPSAIAFGQDHLSASLDQAQQLVEIRREGGDEILVTQVAKENFRPYLHPLVAPDGSGVLTEFSPDHHQHQTGLYWGFTRVNGRDFFHHPGNDYWRRVSVSVLKEHGSEVQWQTVYDLLDEQGQPMLRESQIWTMRWRDDSYELDLQWDGQGLTNVTIGRYDYGGLFLRMPWRKEIQGRVVNSARQQNERAEGQRSVWLDVGMEIEGRDDWGHITIFDHPRNAGFPQAWRVDGQLGVGPVPTRERDWTIAEGETATIQHRLIVHTGDFNDAKMTDRWTEYSGVRNTYAEWNLAQREGREAKFLTPAEAVESMTVQPGFSVNVFASEPDITQPMAFCWDDRGRMWVAENRDYETRQTGFSGSGDSRILILEDTNRDGVADKRTVFLEGIPFPSAIAVGQGGLWLGAPPNLLFVPDADRDDRADMDQIEVRLTGWGILDRHETINSLHWGPDGWLYGCQGLFTPSKVGKPQGEGKIYKPREPYPEQIQFDGPAVDFNGGVWRYHPYKQRFEVVAHGFSNPWGIDYDAKGQLFITACVIPHLWHVIPGGIYHRQGGQHFNRHVYDDIKTIADHKHRSAHGGARIYLSDAFPKKYHERIFMANIHEHAVLTDILQPQGSGYVGRHGDDFLLANNAQWIGFSMEIGPAGDVYVLDWHDADICGKEVLNKETGRIFRIISDEVEPADWPGRYDDLNQRSDMELAELQTSVSAWHARRARVILQSRANRTPEAFDRNAVQQKLNMIFQGSNTDHRLRSLWTLHVTGLLSADVLQDFLDDPDPHVRAWSIQLLCEDHSPSEEAKAKFQSLAQNDPSPVVRLYLASALQRMEHADRWPILAGLAMRGEDANDHNIPKMLWFATEPMVTGSPQQAIDVAVKTRLPLLSRHIARRLSDDRQVPVVVEAIGRHLDRCETLLMGMRDSLEGQFNEEAPGNWATVVAAIESKASPQARQIALQLSQQFGDRAAAKQMLATLRDANSDTASRRAAMKALAGQQHPQMPPILMQLLNNDELRIDAIRAMASFNERQFTSALLHRYPQLTDEEKLEAVQTLASRSESGQQLTQAIRRGVIPRGDIPAYVARVLRRVVGQSFVDVWGPIDGVSVDQQAAFAKYRGLLTPDAIASADVHQGKQVFRKTCGACHKLYNEGGMIGPDITGANRPSLDYLLGNILTPSAEIQDAYRMQMILTDDGRVFSGIPAEENERQLKLWVANLDEPVVIAKSSIESRQIVSVSMMPGGLLQELTDEEVKSLVAYLQTDGPITESNE